MIVNLFGHPRYAATSLITGLFRGKLIIPDILIITDKLNTLVFSFICKSKLMISALDFEHQRALQKLSLNLSKILLSLG